MAHVLVDDLDQTVHTDDNPVLTRRFSFGSQNQQTTYDVDLTEDNYKKIEEALRPFIDVGRTPDDSSRTRTRATRSTKSSSQSSVDQKAVREWAQQNGHKVKDRGRISAEIVDKYNAAQSAKAAD